MGKRKKAALPPAIPAPVVEKKQARPMSRALLLTLAAVFAIAVLRLIVEGEWYLVATLISGLIFAWETILRLFRDEEEGQ